MTRYIRLILFVCALAIGALSFAQTSKWQDLYKVKKKDTIYGIAQKYGITIAELMQANPDMQKSDYVLKKGDQLLIPFHQASQSASATPSATSGASPRHKTSGTIGIGVMLPLHNVDGDGQRMTEYYRGILMACDSLRRQGINTHVYAWNVPIDGDISKATSDPNAKNCDIIFGPLYSKQVKPIGDFCRKNDIRLVIPFSINGGDVETNPNIFQVYQTIAQQNEAAVNAFMERFKDCHPIFVDCNDSTSKKGAFTSALRRRLEASGITYSITNLKSSEAMFAKSFSQTKRNVVVLNTGRSPELNATFAKLNTLRAALPTIKISMFGYTDWMMYTKVYRELYHKYDTYIPSTYFYNVQSPETTALERNYREWFKSPMRQAIPSFAITGYDQAQFFIRGIHKYAAGFNGSAQQVTTKSLQTPLKFKRHTGGGLQNVNFMLVHYNTNHTISTVNY